MGNGRREAWRPPFFWWGRDNFFGGDGYRVMLARLPRPSSIKDCLLWINSAASRLLFSGLLFL
jgi:hypothetical protein